jgi:hypothetical protein
MEDLPQGFPDQYMPGNRPGDLQVNGTRGSEGRSHWSSHYVATLALPFRDWDGAVLAKVAHRSEERIPKFEFPTANGVATF